MIERVGAFSEGEWDELVDGEDQIVVRPEPVGRRLGVRELEGAPDARVVPAGDHVSTSRRERRERQYGDRDDRYR